MQLEFRHITLVAAIARSGSINAAAREIGLSQPTVTAQLARLERHFGASIFVRSATGTTPTAFGEHLIRSTRHLAPLLAELDEQLRVKPAGNPASAGNSLRIGTDLSPLTAGILAVLSRTRPTVRLHLRGDLDPDDALVQVEKGHLDVAVGQRLDGEPTASPHVRHQLLGVTDFKVMVGSDHRLADCCEVDLAGLHGEKWAFPAHVASPRHAAYLRALQDLGHHPTVIAEVTELMVHDLVRSGIAIGLTADPGPVSGVVQIPLTGRPLRARHLLTWQGDVLGDAELSQIELYARDRLSPAGHRSGAHPFG
ncbi:LysR family transcriptional regulator [Amycolatopsis sp. NPDC098790]|uniref:LysR family transcriptional regulator n=1 Tax=Amycolatopsis sp. NPDC098790 TaxID=3363939 RepID=UPI00381867FF